MAFQSADLVLPSYQYVSYSSTPFGLTSIANTIMISANASAKVVLIGRVFFSTRSGSKNIQRVQYRTGATMTVGSGATVRQSIQGVSSSSGGLPPIPDGTIAASGNAFVTF